MTAEDHARLKNLLEWLDTRLWGREVAAAIRALATEHDQFADKADRLHEHLLGINDALSGDRVCDSEGEVRDQAWRLAKIDGLKAEIIAMTDAIMYQEAEQALRAEAEACEIHEAISATIDESVGES